MKFTENLKKLRKEKHVSQEDAAKELQISVRSYARYEGGEREPNLSILWRMADLFDVSIDYLVGRSERR